LENSGNEVLTEIYQTDEDKPNLDTPSKGIDSGVIYVYF